MLDRSHSKSCIIPGICLFDGNVVGDSETELMGFIQGCFHDVAVHAEDFHSVSAVFLYVLNSLPDFLRSPSPGAHVEENAGRSDQTLLALTALLESLFSVASHIADSCYPAAKPELVKIIERKRLAGAAVMEVSMSVNQAGKKIHAAPVKDMLFVLISILGPAGRPDRLNRIPFDEYVHRPLRRGAVAVDDDDIPDDKTGIALAAFHTFCLGA